ncbi:MAG: RsmD family RNA methyltransferase [Bacteroidetes bacterium]|nr:RsmD family RNA methyltransferase [Bacteroidota bacterium]
MRIISGIHKGRNIVAPSNLPARPTTDYAKEGLFNILNNRIDFTSVKLLDLFGGIGSISFEFASRECKSITYVDSHFGCFNFVKNKAKELKLDTIKTLKVNVFAYLKNCVEKFDVIFADPPFEMRETAKIPEIVFSNNYLTEDGILIIEHDQSHDFENTERFLEVRKYGKVHFSIFK